MFNWAKQQLANVAGTQEPEYGPEACQPVGKQQGDPSYTELNRADLKWKTIDWTNVETQTFYFYTEGGHVGFLQVIYSNVAGLRVTCQFNCKIFFQNNEKPAVWSSDPLENYGFDEDQYSFYADGVSLELSEDGNSYTIKSATNDNSLVNVKVTKAAPGFVGGKNGTTTYGTDPKAPWGSMYHAFWPRCNVEGAVITKEGEIDLKGRGTFIHALQGMKPHHAAARWNFSNFHSATYSAILMEYTTPASYGNTLVRVGGIATDGKLLFAGTGAEAKHTEAKQDSDNDWPEPTAITYNWSGKSEDGKDVSAEISGNVNRWDRVDVMAEVPGFVKAIVATAAGTKPYIYQLSSKPTIEVKVGEETKKEEGVMFAEATFIS
ncbi:oxidative stress survival, Svf1-like protein [Aaosphaeria arxii CBS 175.79]|uniref:Ceramide-binding protein SVF1 n=1 Tax=Aaosphaeria arxii CBS 175.79 TaxID=1450172 RepID=A0A6A5Y3S9_9PLEO|nr:oxidative stress survival, Svf1-like protein [Aaosphaeria arxii CBS 175.79]KAF2019929.1 oxidative stress survival, Svf1-like protein [Aaosphaeria arxii CBS 175.79]